MNTDSFDINVTVTPSRQRIDNRAPRPFINQDLDVSSSDDSFESDSVVSTPSAASDAVGEISGAEVC
jgi:hypothetical protein